MLSDELIRHVVEQCGLLFATRSLTANVIEEHTERAHANVVHPLTLAHNGQAVIKVPTNITTGMNGPHELHVVHPRTLDELLHTLDLLRGIGVAPMTAVVGVVLRTIDKHVHLLFAHEVKQAQTVLMAVGIAIIALYHSALRHLRIVDDLRGGEQRIGKQLQQGLHAIIGARLVSAGNHDLTLRKREIVALGLSGDASLHTLHGFLATLPYINRYRLLAL